MAETPMTAIKIEAPRVSTAGLGVVLVKLAEANNSPWPEEKWMEIVSRVKRRKRGLQLRTLPAQRSGEPPQASPLPEQYDATAWP